MADKPRWWTDDPKLQNLAREMCKRDGFDPDSLVTQDVLARGPMGSQTLPMYSTPAWLLYAFLARIAIETLEKANGKEAS